MDFVCKTGRFTRVKDVDLMLLDLNLPVLSGREVLEELKSDPATTQLPVVVLTTSRASEDVRASYERHANAFVTKPVDIKAFMEIVRQLQDFWLTVVRLPTVDETLRP